MRVLLASPTYGPVQPEVYDSVIRAVMLGTNHGVEWAGTGSTDRDSWETARNTPVEAAKKAGNIDGIMWADSDMLFEPFAFVRLVNSGKDLISGLYFQRRPPYFPNAYGWNPKSRKFGHLAKIEENAIMEIGGFGFGCCFTSMKLLRDLPPNPFKFDKYSEDLGFCLMAMKAGYQPYLDTGVLCDHYIGPRWASRKLHDRWRTNVLGNIPLVRGESGLILEGEDGSVHDGRQEDVRGVSPAVP